MDRWPEAVALDLFETVFSLDPLRERLAEIGLPADCLEDWLAVGERNGLALASTGKFEPLRDVLDSALDEICARHRITALPADKAKVLDGVRGLKAHAGTEEGLRVLMRGKIQLVALSNGAPSVLENLLKASGLDGIIQTIVPLDTMKLLKPRREAYLEAAKAANLDPAAVGLISAHVWDIHGAKAAGLIAGYVARGRPYPGVLLKPNAVGQSLADLTPQLVNLS